MKFVETYGLLMKEAVTPQDLFHGALVDQSSFDVIKKAKEARAF
jgi:hypothetical protein